MRAPAQLLNCPPPPPPPLPQVNTKPEPVFSVPVMKEGRQALEAINTVGSGGVGSGGVGPGPLL